VITIPMSRRNMASAIGTRPESLSRAIRQLKESGTTQFSGKHVVIADLDDLLDASENQKSTAEAPE
jgi:CRP-like cAMP-binding protein